jgi:RIO kinase 1
MEFLGEEGVPAPILKQLPKEEITLDLYDKIVESVDKLYNECDLVHADLSEYNVMVWNGKPYLIDFGQAVLKVHPMADEFLERDVGNIIRFFDKAGVNVPEKEAVLKWLKKTQK